MLQPAVAAYGTAFNTYLAETLGVHTDLPYRVLPRDVSQQWNWQGERQEGGPGLAMSSLEAALLEHPGTKVLIVNGRDDLVTPYLASRWLVDQLEIPPNLTGFTVIPRVSGVTDERVELVVAERGAEVASTTGEAGRALRVRVPAPVCGAPMIHICTT